MLKSASHIAFNENKVRKKSWQFVALINITKMFLNRHLVWQSLDPTLGIWSDFVKKKKHLTSFSKKDATLIQMHLFFCIYPPGHPRPINGGRPILRICCSTFSRSVKKIETLQLCSLFRTFNCLEKIYEYFE